MDYILSTDVSIDGTQMAAFAGAGAPAAPAMSSSDRDAADVAIELAALADLVSRVTGAGSLASAGQLLAKELAEYGKAGRVLVGHCRKRGACQLLADSCSGKLLPNSQLAQSARAVMHECALRGGSGSWPSGSNSGEHRDREPTAARHALLAHRQFAETTKTQSVWSRVVKDSCGKDQIVVVFVGIDPTKSHALEPLFRVGEAVIGDLFSLLNKAEGGRLRRFFGNQICQFRSVGGRTILLTLLLAMGLAALPMQYDVSCHCELQPIMRRFIATPFDGRLKISHVAPGSHVRKGDLLATLDTREIEWELSAKQAEAQRVENEIAGHRASHDLGKLEVAKLELERLNVTIDELAERRSMAKIRSPIDGIVLLGDHAKLVGVPLERGKTLFEIAPLDQMVVQLQIPEDDHRWVAPGMNARARFAAFPNQTFSGSIRQIHPRAELREHRNVFIAEIDLPNASGSLMPGMRGQARIATVYRPLCWHWTHKGYAKLLMWLGC